MVRSIEMVMTQMVAKGRALLSMQQVLTTKDSSSEEFNSSQLFPFLMAIS